MQKGFAWAHYGTVKEVPSFWADLEIAEQIAIVIAAVIVVVEDQVPSFRFSDPHQTASSQRGLADAFHWSLLSRDQLQPRQ